MSKKIEPPLKKVILQGNKDVMLEIQHRDNITLFTGEDIYRVQRESHNEDQRNAILWMLPSTITQVILYLIIIHFFGKKLVPLSGDWSISQITIILGIIGVVVVFSFAFFLGKKKGLKYVDNFPVRHYPALLIALSVIVLLSLLFFFYLFDLLFWGLKLDKYLSSFLVAIVLAVVNYFVLYFTFTMSSAKLTRLMTQVMIGGVIIAIVTNSNTFWWERHLSFLGSSKAESPWPFNVTLILSGLLMAALVDSIFISLEKEYKGYLGIKQLRYLLYLTGFSLAMVGLFPYDGPRLQPFLHNKFATLLVILVVIMMFGNQWFLPKVNRSFALTSYGIGMFLAIFTTIFMMGNYITLTGFEIISFLIAFVWLLMMFDYLNHLLHPQSLELDLSLEMMFYEDL